MQSRCSAQEEILQAGAPVEFGAGKSGDSFRICQAAAQRRERPDSKVPRPSHPRIPPRGGNQARPFFVSLDERFARIGNLSSVRIPMLPFGHLCSFVCLWFNRLESLETELWSR